MAKNSDHYTVYCDSIGEEYTLRFDERHGGYPADAAYEAAEYFWSLTKGDVGLKFDLRVFDVNNKDFHDFTVVVDLEPHFTLV